MIKELIIYMFASIGILVVAIVGLSYVSYTIDKWRERHKKYCPKCGVQPDKSWWDYCPNCGAELKERNK